MKLLNKKIILALTKADLIEEAKRIKIKKTKLRNYSEPLFIISSASKIGLNELLDYLWKQIEV